MRTPSPNLESLEPRSLLSSFPPTFSIESARQVEDYRTVITEIAVHLSPASNARASVAFESRDASAIAESDYTPVMGRLVFEPGETVKFIHLPILADVNVEPQEHLQVALTNPLDAFLSAESDIADITIIDAQYHTLTATSKSKVSYTDQFGAKVTVSLSGPGSAAVILPEGPGSARAVVLSGATPATTLSISSSKPTSLLDILVGDTRSSAPAPGIKAINAPKVIINGELAVAGPAATIKIAGLTRAATIALGASTDPKSQATLSLGNVADVSLTSRTPIKSLAAAAWIDTDAQPDLIDAPRIESLTIAGPFQADLHLDAASSSALALKTAKLGEVESSQWNIKGSLGSITAASLAGDVSIDVRGSISTLSVGACSASISAAAYGTITVSADLDNASIRATRFAIPGEKTLKTLRVRGDISASRIVALGDIGEVSANRLVDSRLTAGSLEDTDVFPERFSFFLNPLAKLGKLTLNAPPPAAAFERSTVAAPTISTITVRQVETQFGGRHTGIIAHRIDAYSRAGLAVLRFTQQGDFDAAADYLVRIVG